MRAISRQRAQRCALRAAHLRFRRSQIVNDDRTVFAAKRDAFRRRAIANHEESASRRAFAVFVAAAAHLAAGGKMSVSERFLSCVVSMQ